MGDGDGVAGAGPAVTVSDVEPLIPSIVALMVAVPAATPVASPDELMAAAAVDEDDQCTRLVTSSVEWSEKVRGGREWLRRTRGDARVGRGHRDRDQGAGLTVSTVVPLTPCNVAVIVDVPGATPLASPAAVMVATDVALDAQVTWRGEVLAWSGPRRCPSP